MNRLFRFLYGKFLKLIGEVEAQDPEALLAIAIQKRNETEVSGRNALALKAGVLESLKEQLEANKAKLEEKEAQITALIAAGDEKLAAEIAAEYEALEQEFTTNKAQAEMQENAYVTDRDLLDESLKMLDKDIVKCKNNIRDTKVAEAIAAANATSAGIRMDESGLTDTMARIKEITSERKSKAVGTARVASDAIAAQNTDLTRMKAIRAATSGQALAKFAAKKGIALQTPPATTTPAAPQEKTFGAAPETDKA